MSRDPECTWLPLAWWDLEAFAHPAAPSAEDAATTMAGFWGQAAWCQPSVSAMPLEAITGGHFPVQGWKISAQLH